MATESTAAHTVSAAHTETIAALRDRIDATLRPLLQGTTHVALIDFPSYANVGDSAIWLGQLAYLRSLGSVSLVYSCDVRSYSRDALAKCLGGGVILLSGGGNLGDLWEGSQQLRERVIRDFPSTPIVQLPQSVHFQHRSAVLRAREVFDSHTRLTLLVRDERSLALARNEFRTPSHLCPDMAFCLGPLQRAAAPTRDIVWLSRRDKESARDPRASRDDDIEAVDWVEEPQSALRRLNRALELALAGRALTWTAVNRARSYVWERLADQRLLRGCRMLSAGRSVITDRLHGHVLCVLLDIPHVVLDNSTGKVRSFYETWTRTLPLVRWCDTPAEAIRLAGAIGAQPGAPASRARSGAGR